MKQEKRFRHTGANQKTTWLRNFRPLLSRCLVLNCSGESGPGARRSPVHLDLHRRLANHLLDGAAAPRASVHNSVLFTNRNCISRNSLELPRAYDHGGPKRVY